MANSEGFDKSYACKFGIENREKINFLNSDFHEFKGATSAKIKQICKRIDGVEEDMKSTYEELNRKIDKLYYVLLATALGVMGHIIVALLRHI